MKWKELTNTAYLQKPNGNTPAAPTHKQGVSLVKTSQYLMNTSGMLEIQAIRLMLLAARNQIPGDFMILTGMSGNGYRIIGTIIIMVLLRMGARGKMTVALIGFLVGAAGSARQVSAVQLAASNAKLRVGLPISGSVC